MQRLAATALTLLACAAPVLAHDLFFRAPAYRLAPGSDVVVDVLSGSFSRSENAIERSRLLDLSLVTAAGRTALDPGRWSEDEPKSRLTVALGEPASNPATRWSCAAW